MGFFKICLIFSLLSCTGIADIDTKLHALYMMQNNDVETALKVYQKHFIQSGRHDFDILQKIGYLLFRHGIQNEDPTIFAMTLYGAGLSGSVEALEILEKGLFDPDPQMQMLALHFIAKIEDDRSDELLNQAMSSDFLSTRMEAAFYLAQKKHPHAVGQIEGLMMRLPSLFRPFFPSLFAIIGTNEATQSLKRLLDDPEPQVRIESILNIAHLKRDDLMPLLRKRLTHCNVSELEACAYAMGVLQDSSSIPRLKKLLLSSSDNVKIAASLAIYQLGDRSAVALITKLAQAKNLFAIAALGHIAHSEDILAELLTSNDLQIRLNASIALLQLHDERCLVGMKEILIADIRDLGFYLMPSVGRTMAVWKVIPSAELRSKDQTLDLSMSLSLREHVLQEIAYLPPHAFIQLSRQIIDSKQNDLIPMLISILINLRTPDAIDLLKYGSEKIDAPFIRDYCHLALYNLKVDGSHRQYIKNWVMHQKDAELIQLRPMPSWKMRLDSGYSLTAKETSRLLIDTFLTLASERDIDFMIDAILKGNPQNRYALFGLLMRATE